MRSGASEAPFIPGKWRKERKGGGEEGRRREHSSTGPPQKKVERRVEFPLLPQAKTVAPAKRRFHRRQDMTAALRANPHRTSRESGRRRRSRRPCCRPTDTSRPHSFFNRPATVDRARERTPRACFLPFFLPFPCVPPPGKTEEEEMGG